MPAWIHIFWIYFKSKHTQEIQLPSTAEVRHMTCLLKDPSLHQTGFAYVTINMQAVLTPTLGS